ncbi:serine/threonine protein kinase [Xylanibacillus composti]|uniref:non-specific serine/threonine protein kinase n=1 Tax=Xylanibacillus composti TaxID=1572762 RepID=A0A8J4M291_9BACL|nr:protein kinase [Xylanibacillus composti]GIQ69600.1 serine/threonine protein kinase [Xylanibacillus composti]
MPTTIETNRSLHNRIRMNWAFRRGKLIRGRYRLLRRLGVGSYGYTYLCRDLSHDQLCVLKVSLPARGSAERAARIYQHEINCLSAIRHPHIPALLETFAHSRYLCCTMTYIEGDTLDACLFRDGRVFAECEALQLLHQLLDVVGYLHSKGFVHRDISIANVMLTGNTVTLIDFGLARPIPADETEQLRVEDVEADDPTDKRLRRALHPSSDFYALGHLLLFLLYSGYSEQPGQEEAADASWEEELRVHPDTKKLLRRLLMAEQPFSEANDIQQQIRAIVESLSHRN